jgi:hypothetical protein
MKKKYFLSILVCISFLYSGEIQSALPFTSSNLPIVVINTHGLTIVNEPKITADMGIIDNGTGVRNNITDPFNHYNGTIGIEIRGSSSQQYPKKQYGFETRDLSGEDFAVSLLGMPAESDWILSAQYNDKTLMRDVVVYHLANSLGRYASRTRYCEVVLNGEYMGVYMLFEKIKRDKNRVNIAKLEPDDTSGDAITGGYIIKIDKLDGSGNDGWYSAYPPHVGAWQKIYYQYHYPKPENITANQKAYIKNHIAVIESVFASGMYRDSVNGYAKYVDVPSMVDYFLINEMTKNVDAFRLSFFMHKDADSKNPKIFFGPVWDYNSGFGYADYYNASQPEGWQISYFDTNTAYKKDDSWQPPFWWHKTVKDTAFMKKAGTRWEQLRFKELSLQRIYSVIDSIAQLIDEAQKRNFERWPILNSYVWPNSYVGGSYEMELYYLKQWIEKRFQWMDKTLTGRVLSTQDRGISQPGTYFLAQNFPNPFNPATVIKFHIPKNDHVMLTIHNILGQSMMVLLDQSLDAGRHNVTLNASMLPSGVYFYRLTSGSNTMTKKMILTK